MSNAYIRDHKKTTKKERAKTRQRHMRRLSDYEHVLQEEVFRIPAYEIESYLDAQPDIVRVYEEERGSDHRELQDYDPDEFDPIAEYGEDPYDEDGDFSESLEREDSVFNAIDRIKLTRLSMGQAEDRCDILFTRDETGYWNVSAPSLGKLKYYEPLDANPYKGILILQFIRKRYDSLLKIAEYLANLINTAGKEPLEKNRERFFLDFPDFNTSNINEIFDIPKSTISRLGSAVFHLPIIGDMKLSEILDITKNVETHGKVLSLIDKEDKRNPLKDTEIAEETGITDRNIKNIRAKYGIPNVYHRKIKGEEDE